MNLFFFKNKKSSKELIIQAQARLEALAQERNDLEMARQQKMQRQVELWSIMDLPPDLEAEYKSVSLDIATMIKHVACLDEFMKKLKLEHYHCQGGDCKLLEKLMEVKEPWEGCDPISLGIVIPTARVHTTS